MKVDYKDIFKIPNIISLSRVFLMIPFFYFFSNMFFYETLVIMIIIILTDFFDGFLSRKLNMVTELGKIVDPLADKICLGGGLLYIFYKANINPVVIYILIARDILIVLLGVFISKKLKTVLPSNIWGKLTSFFLSLLGVLVFLKVFYDTYVINRMAFYLYFVSLLFIILSSISYFLRFLKIVREKQ